MNSSADSTITVDTTADAGTVTINTIAGDDIINAGRGDDSAFGDDGDDIENSGELDLRARTDAVGVAASVTVAGTMDGPAADLTVDVRIPARDVVAGCQIESHDSRAPYVAADPVRRLRPRRRRARPGQHLDQQCASTSKHGNGRS